MANNRETFVFDLNRDAAAELRALARVCRITPERLIAVLVVHSLMQYPVKDVQYQLDQLRKEVGN